MELLTLHQLARQFNKPERQVRYRFHELIKAGKLIEDEFHFAYRINP